MRSAEQLLRRSLIFEGAEEIGHGEHSDDSRVGRDGQVTNTLLLHQRHGVSQGLVFLNRDERPAHTAGNRGGIGIEAFSDGAAGEIGIGDDPDIAGPVIDDERADFMLEQELSRLLDRGAPIDATDIMRHIVFDECHLDPLPSPRRL